MDARIYTNWHDQNRTWVPMSRKVTSLAAASQKGSEKHLRSTARHQAQQGDYKSAIALLTQLVERNPSAANYNNRGLIYFQSGQQALALEDYNQALQIDPNFDSTYNNRANCYISQGCIAEALADYEVALNLNPGNVRSWINQAITFREMGLYDLALENLDLALLLGGLECHVYAERGRTYHLRGDWNCAIADYQRAYDQLPETTAGRGLRQKISNWMNQLLSPATA
jgi:tetratricopeptide (TPR) repeat protein